MAELPSRRRWLRAIVLLAAGALAACGADDREARRQAAGANPGLPQLLAVAKPDAGRRLFGQCAACHTIGRGAGHRAGPNLHAILGRPIAGDPRYGYTAALEARGGRWTVEAMDAWLQSPARFAPGTKMNYPGMADPLDRADMIAYLRAAGE